MVDDGSRDRTTQVALQYARELSTQVVRVMTLPKNVGKGGAIQQVQISFRHNHSKSSLVFNVAVIMSKRAP